MRRATALLAAAAAVAVFAAPAEGTYRYERTGEYLDYAKRPSLLDGFAKPFARYKILGGGRGTIEIWPDGRRYVASISDAIYGLWYFTRFSRTGDPADLAQAERAARWLRHKQVPATGIYAVTYPFDLGARDDGTNPLMLTPPWHGSNAQAYPISLLSRLYRETGRKAYLRQAKRALLPLAKTKQEGGVQAPFLDTGEVFLEGYATLPISAHTLSHHVQTLVALHDMSDLSPLARRLFDQGMRTLRVALPRYDLPAQGRSAAWLAHVTDPPRPLAILNGRYQEDLTVELKALDSVRPDPVTRYYRNAWWAQLKAICLNPSEGCFLHRRVLKGK